MPDNQTLPPLPAFFGVESDAALADHVMQIVTAIAVVWAWLERKSPHFRLTVGGK